MEELSKASRYAFIVLTALNALVFVLAIVDLLTTRFGAAGYAIAAIAAPLMSPALLGLPWFDAWARDASVSGRVLALWSPWIICILAAAVASLQHRRKHRAQSH